MTKLQIYDPFFEDWNLPNEIGRLFWGLRRHKGKESGALSNWNPSVDVSEDEKQLMIRGDFPGVAKDDIHIEVRDGILTIRGERKVEEEQKKDNYYCVEREFGSFSRSFTLPTTVDPDKIQASIKDGVLSLSIAKKAEAQPKQIKVEVK